MAVKVKRVTIAELVLQYFSIEFAFVSCRILNSTGAEQTPDEVIGLPVEYDGTNAILTLVAGEADINAVVVDGPPLETLANAAESENEYKVLVRGPAILRKDKVLFVDASGAALTEATIIDNLAAEKILLRTIEGLSSTQES